METIMKKTAGLIIIISLMLSLLTGCGGRSEDVSVFYYTYSDTYISSVRSEINKRLKSEGIGYHSYDANGNQTTQTEQIDTAIAKGTRLLAVNIVDTGSDNAARTIIEKARVADIPVIFFNRSVSDEVIKSYDKCVFIGTDYEMAGHLQGKMIGEYVSKNFSAIDINGDGRISYCLFKGQQGNAEAEARTKYAVEDANGILAEGGLAPLVFYDAKNTNGYLVDQDGTWSNAAANNHMKTVLSAYSEAGGNMVELIIANNDEMALGAIAALNEAGYNAEGGRIIPVFGVDATDAARAKINSGYMTGTVKQDAAGMAEAICTVSHNMLSGNGFFTGIDKENVTGDRRINIPYSVYTADNDG